MKKMALVIAMCCVPLFPAGAVPVQCPAGAAWLEHESSNPAPRDYYYDNVVLFDGQMSMPMAQLKKEHALRSYLLEVSYANQPPQTLGSRQVDAGPDGSMCVLFDKLSSTSSENVITGVSGANGGEPKVCIDDDGTVSATLRITARAVFLKGSRIRFLVVGSGDRGVPLADSGLEGCKASCPAGKTRLVVESTNMDSLTSTKALVAVIGRAPSSLSRLKSEFDLSRSVLEVGQNYTEVGQNYTYFGAKPSVRLRHERVRQLDDGSACIVFDSYDPDRDAGTGLENVADAMESQPNVCISTGGVISARLKVDVSSGVAARPASPDVYVRVLLPLLNKREEILLVDADTKGCTK